MKERKLQIAICDDEKNVCIELEEKILEIAHELNLIFEIEPWSSGESFCRYLSAGNNVDIVFLDIMLTKLSGISVGHFIRESLGNNTMQIIYISSRQNYAMRLFETRPFDFIIKPISISKLKKVVERIVKIMFERNQYFEYKVSREQYKILFEKIIYFRSEKHKVVIVTMENEIEYYGKLKDILKYVPAYFLAIHKSYLVNSNYITRYSFKSVELKNGTFLSISKAYQKEVREKLSIWGR